MVLVLLLRSANNLSSTKKESLKMRLFLIVVLIYHLSIDLIESRIQNITMDTFMALSVPVRRDIVQLLANTGQLSAGSICEHFAISAAAISQHLKVLLSANLVVVERHAKQRIYQLNPQGIAELQAWTKQVNRRFEYMENVLKEQRS